MKRLLLLTILLSSLYQSKATDYYSVTSGDANNLSNWRTVPGNAAVTSFTTGTHKFIVQQGHIMTTTNTWTIGNNNTILLVKTGGTLQGDHLIKFNGNFQIESGGTYIHNNISAIDQIVNESIFGGTESFAANSNFEIRKWRNPINGSPRLPSSPSITWGNLVINLQMNPDADWNWALPDQYTLTINGNLDIRSTYISGTPVNLILSEGGQQTINISGDLLVAGSKTRVVMKRSSGTTVSGSTTMQVNGNIKISDNAYLDLGNRSSSFNRFGNYELRFKGNFEATAGTTVTSTGIVNNRFVANGTVTQKLSCDVPMTCNFTTAPGATVDLVTNLEVGVDISSMFIVLGTFNDNGHSMNIAQLIVAGGTLNSSGPVSILASCSACTGSNSAVYNDASNCVGTGNKGRVNFTNNTVTFGNGSIYGSFLHVGVVLTDDSPGDVYFVNATANMIAPAAPQTLNQYNMNCPNSVLSLDANSYITGPDAYFYGNYGILRIGSPDGITALGNVTTGNVRTGGVVKSYNNQSQTNFEYFGTTPQVTGNGLPATITGTLKINNTAGIGTSGVTLSANTTVKGILELTNGKLTSTASQILELGDNTTAINYSDNSFVSGPMIKTGDESFEFPIGEGSQVSPLELIQASGHGTTDKFMVQYNKANPKVLFPGTLGPGINHMSSKEYWMVTRLSGNATKKIKLLATTYSNATDLSSIVITHNPSNQWQNDGRSAYSGFATGTVTSNAISTYGPFTFASTTISPSNPLPVNLISFNATKLNAGKALINWELANYCIGTENFEVQRADPDYNFATITTVGGSISTRLYSSVDNGLKPGINYYRLKMKDENGAITYSRVVAIMNGVKGLLLTSLFPTIIKNTATLTVTSSGPEKLDIIITDMQGRVMTKQNYSIAAGNTTIELSASSLAAGAYQLAGVTAEGRTNLIRFVKE
jgi:hypothetical protein